MRPVILICVFLGLTAVACAGASTEAATTATSQPPSPTSSPPNETPTAPRERADTIFFGGAVITMDESRPAAEAIAIRGGLIQSVGTDQEVLAMRGPSTQVIDLEGRALMPGFIDGHTHILAFPERKGKSLAEAQETALRYGFTGVNEMWADQGFLDELMQAEREGDLRLRVNVFPSYNDGILDANRQKVILRTWYPANAPILDPSHRLRIPGIKVFVDGDNFQRSRGCWALSEPFEPGAPALSNVPCGTARGDPYWEQDELNQVVAQAQAAGYRVAFHSMGDGAMDLALNAIESALDGRSNDEVRHQIEHNSLVRPDQLARYETLRAPVSVRGYGITGCEDLSFLLPNFGAQRMPWYANRYALAAKDIHAYMETDFGWTIEADDRFSQRSLDPIMSLYGMVTRQEVKPDGSVCAPDPLVAAHAVSVPRALEMLTVEPAYAVSMEDWVGSLEPGKYADLIVLSDDPTSIESNRLKDLQVRMTMVEGKAQYCAAEYASWCQVRTASTAVSPPTGFHDASEGKQDQGGCLAAGWAADPDDRNLDLKIRILVDGAEVSQTTASDARPDLEAAGECPEGTCSFSVNLWALISHNAEHSVLIEAQDAQSGAWVSLNASPKALNCTGQ